MNNVNFKSRYNPVPGFSINTKLGKLNVKEVSLKDKNIDNDIVQSANLFLYNYATNTEEPGFFSFLKTGLIVRSFFGKICADFHLDRAQTDCPTGKETTKGYKNA